MPKPATSPSGQPRKRITVRLDPALLPSDTDWGEDFSPLIERLLYAEMERRSTAADLKRSQIYEQWDVDLKM